MNRKRLNKVAGWLFVLFFSISGIEIANAVPNCSLLLSHTFLRLQDEAPQSLCQYQGKVILAVNTASFCGFTSQYEGLEKIYAKYKDRGFVVLGFPSNDFGQQEPGSNKEIADFCKNTYDVKFPMFSKSNVSGSNPNPLFKMLIAKTGTTPKWNFYKYLIDRNGNVIDSFGSMTKPTSSSITNQIEKLLEEKVQ
ncbi:glutathione peroxidase [Polynucleobacter sp. JS-JIR-5-A7]|uniref:glutathione peroxidase n=1 Tax=Polynucleobacter sp. JS-JIR-5-A7 TaxID=1758395 RepID=UPI001BFD3094|nr:glutathione peroxidase [Polynucleobacter sp. JS-JIR-5-A7]QWE06535.1 glutathione peroxidase [Polynucleobacter sp. JS-JIR-5-A7]